MLFLSAGTDTITTTIYALHIGLAVSVCWDRYTNMEPYRRDVLVCWDRYKSNEPAEIRIGMMYRSAGTDTKPRSHIGMLYRSAGTGTRVTNWLRAVPGCCIGLLGPVQGRRGKFDTYRHVVSVC
ncbi:unnamed protein product [Cochlearia groenlandica]